MPKSWYNCVSLVHCAIFSLDITQKHLRKAYALMDGLSLIIFFYKYCPIRNSSSLFLKYIWASEITLVNATFSITVHIVLLRIYQTSACILVFASFYYNLRTFENQNCFLRHIKNLFMLCLAQVASYFICIKSSVDCAKQQLLTNIKIVTFLFYFLIQSFTTVRKHGNQAVFSIFINFAWSHSEKSITAVPIESVI